MPLKRYTAISVPDSPDKPWRSLHIFNLYRLTMTGIIAVIFFLTKPGETTLGSDHPVVFTYTISIWIGLSLANGFASRMRQPSFHWQVAVTILLDIIFISVLMYASGGIGSGLGTLMLVTVAASGILISGITSFAFAAIATLSILGMHSYSYLLETGHSAYGFTHIGMLGAGLFAVALLTHTLSLRIRESEELAYQRGSDLADLSQVNELILREMNIGVLVVSNDEQILFLNDAALNILDIDSEIAGQSLANASPRLYMQYLSWKENTNTEIPPIRVEKSSNEVLARFNRIGKSTGIATAVFLEDTAQLAHQAQQIKLASLGRLTASIAHEIRNPLGAINHASQLLAESPDFKPQDARLTEIINTHTERLNTIVESILALSRREEYTRERIDVCEWLQQFTDKYANELHFSASNISMELDSCSGVIQFDSTHLGQVMCNLSENAFKHSSDRDTSRPNVTIRCTRAQIPGSIQIDVIDTGPGVAEENIEKLFEPFFTTNAAGTGLGLFIARELAELNNAHLIYVHEKRKGACFRLTIPVTEHMPQNTTE